MDFRVDDKALNAVTFLAFVNQVWPGSYDTERTQCALARTLNITAYDGDALVAKGVQLEACSVEDSGKTVSFNVFVYNIQPGVIIDYTSGRSERDPSYITPEEAAAAE